MGKKEKIVLMEIFLVEGDNNTFKIGCSKADRSDIFEFGLVGDRVCIVDCLRHANSFPIGAIIANCTGSSDLVVDAMDMKINKNLIASWIKMIEGTGKVDLRDDCKSLFARDDNWSQAMENIRGAFITAIMLEFSRAIEDLEELTGYLKK